MQVTNVYQAKTQFSALLDQALAGEDVVIARYGKPIVRLVPFVTPVPKRKFGELVGAAVIPDNFDDESPEINKLFYGDAGE